jgi:uncharacterized alkaline shock family protein YloU
MRAAAANSKKTPAPRVETPAPAQNGSELGEVKIHENVIASLVRRAALSIEGVSRLAGNTLVDSIAEVVGSRRMQSRAITIEMGDNNRVSIEIKLVLKFGCNIPEVAGKVQKAVIEGVEKVTGMTVTKVGVVFQDIEDEEQPEEGQDDENANIDSIPMN